MITVQDIGNEAVYSAVLKEVKKTLPLGKKLFKSKITKEEASQLTKLEIQKTELVNLDFLKYFPKLLDLRIKYVTRLSDISGLQNCPDLKEFELVNSDVVSLDDIACCRNLTYFCYYLEEDYKQYGKSDFAFLQNLTELEAICITGNRLEDVSIFENLHKVKHLVLEDNPIKTIAPLKKLQSLDQLELEFCGLTELEDLSEFRALKLLFLEGNVFTEEQKAEYLARYPHIVIDFEC